MFIKDRIKTDSTKRVKLKDGSLRVPAVLARTGLQEYLAVELGLNDRDPYDTVIVYRPPEEVFDKNSIESFNKVPVTNDHPSVGLVDDSNVAKFKVGIVASAVTKEGDTLIADLLVTDKRTIKDIEDGKEEISNGYTSEIDFTPGKTPRGESYDAVQRNIVGNHVAVVDRGRCGGPCRISDSTNPQKVTKMKVIINGVEYVCSDTALASAILKVTTDLSDTIKERDDAIKAKSIVDSEAISEIKKELDTTKAQLDAANAQILTPEKLDQYVINRMVTVDGANALVKDFKHEGKNCEEIRKEVVDSLCDAPADASVDYYRAYFDSLLSLKKKGVSSKLKTALGDSAGDETDMDDEDEDDKKDIVADARAAKMQRNKERNHKKSA